MNKQEIYDYLKERNIESIVCYGRGQREEEKNVYRRRYKTNKAFFESLTNKLFYKNENFIEIDEDSKKLSKKK